MQKQRGVILEEEVLVEMVLLSWREQLSVPDQLLGTFQHGVLPGPAQHSWLKLEHGVSPYDLLLLQELLVALLAAINQVAELSRVKGGLFALLLEYAHVNNDIISR